MYMPIAAIVCHELIIKQHNWLISIIFFFILFLTGYNLARLFQNCSKFILESVNQCYREFAIKKDITLGHFNPSSIINIKQPESVERRDLIRSCLMDLSG
jgi:hypothetical protein